MMHQFVDGPPVHFGTGTIANQATMSVVGTCGSTVVLSTVNSDNDSSSRFNGDTSVAATSLALYSRNNNNNGGTTAIFLQDVFPPEGGGNDNTDDDDSEYLGHPLYAGTRNDVVMLEWTASSNNNTAAAVAGLPKSEWEHLLKVARASIQPILDRIDDLCLLQQQWR